MDPKSSSPNIMGNCMSSKSESKELQPYIYEPLAGPNTIRVLNLHINTDDSIRCNLRQIEISAGGYQALSYVWGSSATVHRAIVTDDKNIPIGYLELTRNLWNALHDLRNWNELESKSFWIDQICIDQHGSEKGAQVGLMGEIFSGGTRTITYLGPSDHKDEETQGIELLHKINSHFEPNYGVFTGFDDLASAWDRQSELPITELPKELEALPYERWMWLCNIAYPEWATRLWIVQEQLLPKEVVMLRGTSLFAFESLALLSTYFDLGILPEVYANRFWQEQRPRGQLEPFNIARAVYQLWKQRLMNQKSTNNVNLPLLENIKVYQKLQCCDSRDRFYALLGISADRNVLDIVPKYSKQNPAMDIRQLCAGILERSPNFVPLTLACSWNNLHDASMPSWAFETPRPPEATVESMTNDVHSPHPYQSRITPIRFSTDCLVAIFKGRILDRITFVTPQILIARPSHLERKLQRLLSRFKAIAAIWKHSNVNLENTARLGRVLTMSPKWTPDALSESKSLIEKQAYCFWCYFRDQRDYLIDMAESIEEDITDQISDTYELTDTLGSIFLSKGLVKASPSHEIPPQKQNEDSSEDDDAGEISPEEEAALEELSRELIVGGRTLCVTESGKFCNGMNEIKENDVIAALEGADRLYILRPVGNQYQLVGDAYVDGLMDREAYKCLDPREVDHDIELV
jgi:hypothetical protein